MSAKTGDPTDHAEVYALKTAYRMHGLDRIRRATNYASGEPCTMCAGTILRFDIARVVFATPEALLLRLLGGAHGYTSYPSAGLFAVAGDRIEVVGGVLVDESIVPFELWIKQMEAKT